MSTYMRGDVRELLIDYEDPDEFLLPGRVPPTYIQRLVVQQKLSRKQIKDVLVERLGMRPTIKILRVTSRRVD